jgi:DNA polymerase elongation subunit (family B)
MEGNKKTGTLIKVLTSKRRIRENTEFDSLLIIYRDERGEKKTIFVDRAEAPYYIIKDKTSPEATMPQMFIEKDKVEKVTTYTDLLFRELAAKTDSLHYFDRVITTWGMGSSNMKNLFKHNWLYDTDMDYADRYMAKFHEEYEPDINYKLHKCYFDIETDLMPDGFKRDSKGNIGYMGFPDEEIAPCPVNIITLFDEKAKDIHTFVVRNDLNKEITKLENGLPEFKQYIRQKLAEEDGLEIRTVNVTFYNAEEEAIEAFLKKTHEIDPDFMLAWNQSFDVITLQNRLKKLYSKKKELRDQGIKGYDQMIGTFSDDKYLIQKDRGGNMAYLPPRAYYMARKDRPFVDRTDYFDVMDGINWFDQMLYYANIRKSGGQKESYSLDAVAGEELDKEKLTFEAGETFKTLPWTNFRKFAEYNIRDVVLLHLIEDKNLDMDLLQRLSEITNTRKDKVFRKTVSLKNFVNKFAADNGFIMGNNKNAKYGDDSYYYEDNFLPKNSFPENDDRYRRELRKEENYGGFVLDPNKNLPDNGVVLNGKPSKFVFEDVFDMDFSSLYPSIIRAYNLDKNTQVGKFFLVDDHIKGRLIGKYDYDGLFTQSKNVEAEEGSDGSSDDLGTTLVDSLQSFNMSRVGEKFFDLPSTEELIGKIEEAKKKKG